MKSNEVYKITNKVNGKIYIGITNQGSGVRYYKHWSDARKGDPCPIHKAMAKYGKENFTLEIIDFADTYDELKEKEKFYIKKFNSMDRSIGYNLTEGGDGTFGRFHSEETKEKIRQKALGRKASEEAKKKMSESRKGKCSDKMKSHLQEISKLKCRKVYQYDRHLNFIAEYNSITEAVKNTGICKDTITNQLKNPPKNLNDWRIKFIWKDYKIEDTAQAA